MQQFLQRHAADVTGVLSGFDRLRFRGTMRLIANARGLMSLMAHLGVLVKDFTQFALGVTAQVRGAVAQVAATADRPLLYLPSPRTDKERVARDLAARDHITHGLIGVLGCVERCRSFDLRSDKAKGWLVVEPAPRKCQHYYLYYVHERFGFMHLRFQSWLPLNVWVCMNGREWLARDLTVASSPFARQGNCIQPGSLPIAQALLDAQVTCDWAAELTALVEPLHPQHLIATAVRASDFPLHYYWSLEESEWASDVLFRAPDALRRLYPRLIHHGVEALSCAEVMRYLGKRPNRDDSIPLRCAAEVVTDLRPAAAPARRAEAVRLKHRVNGNWVKMYDKADTVLRVETVINDARDLRVYRHKEGEAHPETTPKQWRPLRKGVADVGRRAELSQQANARYLDALAAVDATVPVGTLAAPVCRQVRWKGRPARGLNPLASEDAALLRAIHRGEFTITGFRNRDLRECLFGATPSDLVARRRQSGQVTRRIRLLRAHGLVKKVAGTHRYHVTSKGRVIIAALLTAAAANTRRLLEAA